MIEIMEFWHKLVYKIMLFRLEQNWSYVIFLKWNILLRIKTSRVDHLQEG